VLIRRMRTVTAVVVCSASHAFLSGVAFAQDVPNLTVATPLARSRSGFTLVEAVHELPDGRLVVLDTRDASLTILDARLSGSSPLGRQGRGPAEYQRPLHLFPLRGDSAAVIDWSQRHALIVTPQGTLIAGPPSRGGIECALASRVLSPFFWAADAAGRFFSRGSPVRVTKTGTYEASDSAAVQRWTSPCGCDTVAFVPNPWGRERTEVIGAGIVAAQRGYKTPPFPAVTLWAVAADGRVAIVRPNPYRVDIVQPNGTRRDGTAIGYSRIRVTAAMKQQWRDEQRAPQLATQVTRNGGTRPELRPPSLAFTEPSGWPEYLPPFADSAALFAPDGRLWIRRTATRREAAIFDVIGDGGQLVARVTFPDRSRIVGFGRGAVYAVRSDSDDVEYVEKYGPLIP
jgi:hypothetical protein